MLEGFKRLDISYFDLEFESTEELYKLAQHGYVTLDPNFVNSDTDDDNDDSMSSKEPNNYGPIEGVYGRNSLVYLSALEAEQVNFAYAIISADIDWLKRNTFNPETVATRSLHYNYALFKHVFVWVLPHFPTNDAKFNVAL